MYDQDVKDIIAKIERADAGSPRKRITILGAGMAGLVAAYELSRLGHHITLIDAQARIGGRVRTHRFKNGDYHELGAMRIPKTHHFTRYYIDKCGLKLRKFINSHDDPDSFYFIRGIRTTHRDAVKELLPKFQLSANELSMIENADGPEGTALLALLAPLEELVNEILSDQESLDALFGRGPLTELIRKLESQTIYDFLREHLDTEDAIELVGAITGLEVWWDKAVTMLLRDDIVQHDSDGLDEIVGGLDLLPKGIFSLLEKRDNVVIELNTEIHSISNEASRVQFTSSPRGKKEEIVHRDADYLICTIPFAVLRRMEVTGVSAGKMRAIRNLTYASSAKVLFSCRERFWESNDGICGSGSQQDLINRQIYYPSDLEVDESQPLMAKSSLNTVIGQYAQYPKPKRTDTTPRSGALVGSYCWGSDARRLGSLSHKDRAKVVLDAVGEIHREALEPGMILDSVSMFWDEFDWNSGAFCFMKPKDFELYYQDTIKPEGKLLFAGEHCSLDQGWIQGAISSSLNAVLHLVEQGVLAASVQKTPLREIK